MHRLSTVLCTSGLAAEAKIARAAGFPVVIGAGDRERTAALVESAVQGANCLISFGIAGALAPVFLTEFFVQWLVGTSETARKISW